MGKKRKKLKKAITKPLKIANEVVTETTSLVKESGELKQGLGLVSGVISLTLAILCFFGVIAFYFPAYLTTPELRAKYSVDFLRNLMFYSMVISGGISIANILLKRSRNINILSLTFIVISTLLGGSGVEVKDFPSNTPYIGLDWFILDLLGSTMIFILIEKIFPLYKKQPIFRKEWQTDFIYFVVNHFLVGLVLLIVNFLVHKIFGLFVLNEFQNFIQNITYLPQVFLCVLVADLIQYWVHRAYHEIPFLWRIHSIHHSIKTMDWLAGSRIHILELIFTRVSILGVLYVFGFEKTVMDAYIIIVGFQAVLNHSNVSLPWGFLKYFIVTPEFHHWHHSSEKEALDRNYAAHFSFLDYFFGTVVKSKNKFPEKYGVVGDYIPNDFIKQQLVPFKK
ncbi:MAG: sterol desaturase family protein [Candidatus Sericytochromatia bacterium]